MPPKRKAASKKTSAAKAKKAKEDVAEPDPEPGTLKDKIAKLKAADAGKAKKRKPDSHFPYCSSSEVHEDYDAMLNQTNIGHNNNKFYIIQLMKTGSTYYVWNRWGRVGEVGQNALKGPFPLLSDAVKDFEKKFSDKTRNKWANRNSFTPVAGKYTLLEMAGEEDDEDDDDTAADTSAEPEASKPVGDSTLDKTTQSLIKLIFDNDMFKEALQKYDIDVKKMPLGKLSKTQIAKGFEALEELEQAIEKGERGKYNALTSKFYTIIPHSFGRKIPPPITTIEGIQAKYDMLAVLGDIEIAQSIQKDKKGGAKDTGKAQHPLDVNYGLLNCDLELVEKKSNDYKLLEKYFEATEGNSWRSSKLKNIWTVNRREEGIEFATNDKIQERKLLWHGTSVAVVTAILKTGLRIMPHSGGRVGRGIYFASEHNKSAGYVGTAQGKGIMFLNEVAIGKQHRITNDDSSLRKAPAGYDSVLACGQQEPDSKFDKTLTIQGKTVVVPQSKPKTMPEYQHSSFWQSEYLVYREDQCRIRYLLLFDM